MLRVGTRQIRSGKRGRLPSSLDELLRTHRIGTTGRAFLKSILTASGDHRYRSTKHLVASLKMRNDLASAAAEVTRKVGFATAGSDKLDRKYWRMRPGRRFECRRANYAASVKAALLDKQTNVLECKGLTELTALYALLLAVRDRWFDQLLDERVSLNRLSISNLNGELVEHEEVGYVPDPLLKGAVSEGAKLFRPGDIVAFPCNMSEAANTQWRVENAICVGWKATSSGSVDYAEPLFAGGGVKDAHTEAEMKFLVYDNVRKAWTDRVIASGRLPSEPASAPARTRERLEQMCKEHFRTTYGTDAQMETEFAVKMLKSPSWQSPNVKLNPAVMRISVLGGRVDLPGRLKPSK